MLPPLPTLSGNHLHLWPVIREAVAFPWQYRQMLWKWVLVCGTLAGLTNYVLESYIVPESEKVDDLSGLFDDLGYTFILGALSIFVYTLFCIRCHRLVLLKPTPEIEASVFQLGKREYNFLSFLLKVCLRMFILIPVILLIAVLSTLIGISDGPYQDMIFWLVLGPPTAYILGRFCMVFPATAIDLEPSLAWAWEQSKDLAWRLGILAGVLPWLFSFIYEGKLFFGIDQYALAHSITYGFLSFIFIAIEVAVISIAFRELSGFESPQKT